MRIQTEKYQQRCCIVLLLLEQSRTRIVSLQVVGKLQKQFIGFSCLFDGADDLEDISGLWPPNIHSDRLSTSRKPNVKSTCCISNAMRFRKMNENEALDPLFRSARLDVSSKELQETSVRHCY